MNNPWRRCICALWLALAAAALLGCAGAGDNPVLHAESVAPRDALIRIAAPSATPSAVPEPSPTPKYPTPTPVVTYVPIPPSTPRPDNATAAPTPAWATPFPSPDGLASVAVPKQVEMVTVNKKTTVNGSLLAVSWHIGFVQPGERYRLLLDCGEYYRIDYNGQKGYIRKDSVALSAVRTAQTDDIVYTMGSWNVHNLGQGTRVEQAAALLRELDLDVVGIQEIDNGTVRAGGRNLTRLLCEAAGYPYWYFSQATGYDGGAYGTAILSKYPILASQTIPLEVAAGNERRSMGYVLILTPSGAAHVFNTHLCPSQMCYKSVNLMSFRYELTRTGLSQYVVSGDFNVSPGSMSPLVPFVSFANVTANTFGDGTVPKILDNILYAGVQVYDVSIADTVESGLSDHRLVSATVLIRR